MSVSGWSPQKIAARFKRDCSRDIFKRISPETIYVAICTISRGQLRRMLGDWSHPNFYRWRENRIPAFAGMTAPYLEVVSK